jgi:hypothetical protein
MNNKSENLIRDFETWYAEVVIKRQVDNVRKAGKIEVHTFNPFLAPLTYAFFTDRDALINEPSASESANMIAHGIAKALVYQKVAGTSMSTSFGTNIQKFIATQLEKRGLGGATLVSGMDIEFIANKGTPEERTKYMQIKAGPQTINYDDVETIKNHFNDARNLARTNDKKVQAEDFMVGVIYGERDELSGNYRKIENETSHRILIGRELWTTLFGDENLYDALIAAASKCTTERASAENLHNESSKAVSSMAASKKIQSIARKMTN